MRLYSIMIELITFHIDRKYCGRSQAIAGVIIDHHTSQNSLMVPFFLFFERSHTQDRLSFLSTCFLISFRLTPLVKMPLLYILLAPCKRSISGFWPTSQFRTCLGIPSCRRVIFSVFFSCGRPASTSLFQMEPLISLNGRWIPTLVVKCELFLEKKDGPLHLLFT